MNPDHDDIPEQTDTYDLVAERGILGAMMLSRDRIADAVEVVKPGHYYRPAHELIHRAITDLDARGDAADPITVGAELKKRGEIDRAGGRGYLHALISPATVAANVTDYAEIVAEKYLGREIAKVLIRATGQLRSGEGDVASVMAFVQGELLAAEEQQPQDDTRLLMDGLGLTLDKIEHLAKNKGSVTGVPTGFADLDSLTQGLQPGQVIIVAARPAIGKALGLDTPLPTPTGWTTMGDVQVGDYLIGADGKPTRVVAVTDVMSDRPCFDVEFSDGAVITADADHQWVTETRDSRIGRNGAVPAVRTTKEIAETLRCLMADRRLNHSVLNASAAQFPEADLPIGPYTLGAWLGDGHTAAARITTPDPEVLAEIEKEGYRICRGPDITHGIFLPPRPPLSARNCVVCGDEFQPRTSEVRTCGRSCGGKAKGVAVPDAGPMCPDCGQPFTGTNGMCRACRADHGTVQALLRRTGVLGNKHIPAAYLRASESQRRALLAGLLDSDGYCAKTGTTQFAVTRERLARDAYELVLSLGYKPTLTSKPAMLNGKDCGTAWTVTFTTSDPVFRLPRKGARIKPEVRSLNRRRFITDVRQVGSVPVRCVQVDNEDHLYLASRSWIPTHNSTLALDFCRAAAIKHKMPAALFSLEMGRDEINMRLISAEAKVGLHNLRSGHMTDEDWSRIAKRLPEIQHAPLWIDDSPNLGMAQIRAKARRLRDRHGLRLLVIDYLQLMQSGGKRSENRQLEVSEMSRGLKLLAKELEIPIVALSQLNRGPEQRTDKRPAISDLRESGSIENDADVVLLLHRADAYEKESPRAGEADFIVAKHRNGPTATITTAFQGHYSRFVDMAQS